ncbi:MAG: hypothetical protein AB1633_12250 [Elusimicrobiota bacterium]
MNLNSIKFELTTAFLHGFLGKIAKPYRMDEISSVLNELKGHNGIV